MVSAEVNEQKWGRRQELNSYQKPMSTISSVWISAKTAGNNLADFHINYTG